MYLAINNVDIPDEYKHDPAMQDKSKNTVAMYMVGYNKVIPECWRHNPTIC